MMRQLTILGAAALLLVAADRAAAQPMPRFLGKTAAQWTDQLKNPTATATRRSAAFALGKLGVYASTALPELKKLYRTEKDAGTREAIVVALGEVAAGTESVDADLETLLIDALQRDPDQFVRRSAALSLGLLGSKTDAVRTALGQAMTDPKQVVRQNAAWSLGRLDAKAAPALVQALHDETSDALVKRDAANALYAVSLGNPALVRPALDDLLAMCRDTDAEIRKAGLKPLVRALKPGDKAAVPILTAILGDPDLEVRRFAALALSKIGGPGATAAVPVLVADLHHPDPEVKKSSFLAIRKLGKNGVAAIPSLIKVLEGPDPENARNAALALGGMGPAAEPAVPALVKVMRDPALPLDVRIDAGEALVGNPDTGLGVGDVPAVRQRIPEVLELLADPREPGTLRLRAAWLFNAFLGDSKMMGQASPVMAKVCGETLNKNNGEARFHCAYLLGLVKTRETPDAALNVLADVLQDDTFKLYKNKAVKFDASGSEVKTKSSVELELVGDGRSMAVEVLGLIGRDRILARDDIVKQLRVLAGDPKTFPDLRTQTKELLKKLGR